jgi:hypothetical protein
MKCPVCDKEMKKSKYKITTELEINGTIARSILVGYKCKPHVTLPAGKIGGKYMDSGKRLMAILYEPAMGFTIQHYQWGNNPNQSEVSAFALASRRVRFTTGIEGAVTCLNNLSDLQIMESNYGVIHYLPFKYTPIFNQNIPGARRLWDINQF